MRMNCPRMNAHPFDAHPNRYVGSHTCGEHAAYALRIAGTGVARFSLGRVLSISLAISSDMTVDSIISIYNKRTRGHADGHTPSHKGPENRTHTKRYTLHTDKSEY